MASLDQLHERQGVQERAADHRALLDWITLANTGLQQSDFINQRQAGIGTWLLESPEFKDWLENGNTMYCPGMPGAGKTLLTAVVVEELNSRFQGDESVAVTYLYCNFRRQHEQRADDLLSSLLRQLIQPLPSAPDCVQSLYKRHKSFGTNMSFDEILTCLKSVITNTYSRVFFYH
jgi:Cdc6-like AAA superfamily ATPase